MNILDKIAEAVQYIKNISNKNIDVAIILGTGLGSLADDIENKEVIKYRDIPYFPISTVFGHAGELIIGDLCGKRVLALNGRFHYYEGYNMEQITFPVRVIKALGIDKIIISNAAGGMNPNFKAGDLMIITDHINLLGNNPLIGRNYDELGPRFPDMSEAYNKNLIELAEACAYELEISVQRGVYVAVSGPNYETPSELKAFRLLGADAVGMSTIPEVIVANHMNMKVLGISCITDMAIEDDLEPLEHERVVETANMAMTKFVSLVKGVISRI
jgi:purine-nucleoside phosphorylase